MAKKTLTLEDRVNNGIIDLTKTGPLSYRELRSLNNYLPEESKENQKLDINIGGNYTLGRAGKIHYTQDFNDDFGESMFDDALANQYSYSNYQDLRGERQPWYAKLGAGLAKAATLAGTTFLDGTVGLITGVVEGIRTKVSGGSWGDSISKLWDNEVSNGLASLNESLEEILPNYRTKEEMDNPWYKNLGTMNFWADGVLKNLGFAVGAFYSGGAWNKALKAVGTLKGSMGAKITGSFLSAVNEGRIEANHGAKDFLDLQYASIVDEAIKTGNSEAQYLKNLGYSDEDILDQLSSVDPTIHRITEDAKARANSMGLTTLIGNTVLLSLNNYAQFGKLYARGFKEGTELSPNIIKKGGEYAWKDITKKQAIAKGLSNGLIEGNEEMSQAFISETAGQMQSYDSPNAYYEALTDPQAQLKTKDFLTSVTEGFVNTYGNGDRWEEFAIGAFTGLLGMPTFGKVNNSDSNTYLGKGKSVGLSGGLFGEIKNANRLNREGEAAVDVMNQYMGKLQNKARYFTQSQSFTNAMNGWAEEKNMFEYKNAQDNDDFAAISSFASAGKLNDLKEMVNQDFENLSDEELEKIALYMSPDMEIYDDGEVSTTQKDGKPKVGGWRDVDGSLMSSTEEGRDEMRRVLSGKRDKILKEIDRYKKSVETVRAIGNNSLTEDQVNELAWLNWKVGMFNDRYKDILKNNEEFISKLRRGITAFQAGRGRGTIDEESEEGKTILKNIDTAGDFIEAIAESDNSLQLANLIESNPELLGFTEDVVYPILEDMIGLDEENFEKGINDLKDVVKLAKAAKSFNQRYKEFKEDPIKLIENRTDIDKKKEKISKASQDISLKDKVDNSNVSDIVNGIENGDLSATELDGLFSEEDNEFLNNVDNKDTEETSNGKQKVEEAKKIIQTSERMRNALFDLEDESITQQSIEDAVTLLNHSKEVSESEKELLDTATQAYNDPTLLYEEGDPSIQGLSQEDIMDTLNERIDTAKSVIEYIKATLAEENEELENLPSNSKVVAAFKPEEVKEIPASKAETQEEKTTGHDATTKVTSENERRKEEEKKEVNKKDKEEQQNKVNSFFSEVRKEVSSDDIKAFDKALSEVLENINRLLSEEIPLKELGKIVKDTQSYKTLKTIAPSIDEFLNVYITHMTNKSSTNPKIEKRESGIIKTPIITEEEVRAQTTTQLENDPNKQELTSTYQYWKPTISYLPFGKAYEKGNGLPFWSIARFMKNYNGTKMFTDAQIKRIEAVGKYLEDHGAFKLVDSGEVKVGDKISFVIDSTLNDEAGETVILMADSQGRIVGDVMSKNDAPFQKQAYLPVFVEKVLKEYEEAGSPQYFTSSLSTVVDKNMVGKAPYLADHEIMNTLNAIHSDGNTPIPFLIGIAANSGENARVLASAGRTKRQGQSALERSILPPVTAKAGQPFLLMPTSSTINHYMPVPITMAPYNSSTKGTALGQAIHKVLERIPTSDNNNAINIIRDLEELISVQEIHINYSGDNVKVTIKPNKAEHQVTIYNGLKNSPNIVEQLELGLQGQPFQISRKYINEDYNGQSYNRMIGEIAKTNLPIGATHTVSDWFTLKPIDAAGNIAKAKSPRSTGRNPNSAKLPVITIVRNGVSLQVNSTTWEVSDGKKTYTGKNADKVRAMAFGIHTNQNLEQPYDTEWGYFDPLKYEFVGKPDKVLVTLGATEDTSTQENLADDTQLQDASQLEEKAKKAGLLGNKTRQALWQMLTPEQQTTIVDKKGPKQKQWMNALEAAWTPTGFDESKLKGSVDTFLGRKGMYRRTDGSRSVWNRERETQWLSKVLPNLSTEDHLRIVEGLESIPTDDGGYAYGKFQNGIITISDIAARGTMYHEAFHAVTHTLLTSKEYQKLFDAAVERWGDIDSIQLEENLAEDFRKFMQSEEEWYDNLEEKGYSSIRKTLSILFHKLKNLTKELSGKTPYINKLYYSINRGKYSRRHIKGFNDNARYSRIEPTIEWMQKIVNNNVNNPMVNKSRVAKNTAWGRLVDSWLEEGYLIKGYWDTKTKQWTVSSIKKANTAFNQEAKYRKIEQYHRDKYLYNNLSQENKSYLQEKGISIEEFSEMTQLEKEVLFRCKH